jgi:hypothetical protein
MGLWAIAKQFFCVSTAAEQRRPVKSCDKAGVEIIVALFISGIYLGIYLGAKAPCCSSPDLP